jgi:hypothetical protein
LLIERNILKRTQIIKEKSFLKKMNNRRQPELTGAVFTNISLLKLVSGIILEKH